ncbi:tRNA pseudouridine(13) synthase TruD [Vibrio sp. TH_r3]|uniref:tRNA pseudouridine(13) synthase TruD n=1 Tax=Vibrio sp. TH_r3 TaxID=3082084 RepID=UPI0029531DC8|nr:tRNA pseudouridine(13) synthase TruD [Vibrio sp. TH_r3]MDV7105187.1 tRNA pseudouridine(13) synthase TruD [Vibrio sp. TH_r3]
MTDILAELAYLHGKPTCKAKLKAKPEHFVVKEQLGFDFSGSGEHLMIKVRKTGENTSFVANELAKVCGVKSKDMGWAGQKDRHAVTEQWLSVYLPKADTPDFTAFEKQYPSIQILETTRHNKKLRPGDLSGNQFQVTLSEVSDISSLESKIKQVIEKGVPNYFGSQRFGRAGNNLTEARRWGKENVRSKNQNKRSLYLSTARSWIFNQIVSKRINVNQLSSLMLGDIVRLNTSVSLDDIANNNESVIVIDNDNLTAMQAEIALDNVVLTAALVGDNSLPTKQDALCLEQEFIDAEPDLMALIRSNRMRHDRRDVLLKPSDFSYTIKDDMAVLCFSLSSGSFATSIVRELIEEIPVERHFNEG